jgi:L-iditol 2-dehydrogenase
MNASFRSLMVKAPRQLAFEDVPLRPCGPTEVLVKIQAASLCNGSDRNMYLGHPRYRYPLCLGHEPFGTVVDRGSQVRQFEVGDGVCWWFSLGAFAEYCYADTAQVAMVRLRGRFDPCAASILELAAATARGIHAAELRPEQRVLIIGLGPSGLLFTQQLRLRGASDLAAWEVLPNRTRHGLRLGLRETFNPLVEQAELDDYLHHVRPFDLVIDCYGDDARDDGQTFQAALTVLKPGGTLIKYGHPIRPRVIDHALVQQKGIRLVEAAMPISVVQQLLEEQADHFLAGRLDLDALVTHRIALADVEATLLDQIAHPDNYIKAVVQP